MKNALRGAATTPHPSCTEREDPGTKSVSGRLRDCSRINGDIVEHHFNIYTRSACHDSERSQFPPNSQRCTCSIIKSGNNSCSVKPDIKMIGINCQFGVIFVGGL